MSHYVEARERGRIRPVPLFFLFAVFAAAISGCNRGLSPLQSGSSVRPGFGGMIKFDSPWPSPDSVLDLRVVAFENYPPSNIFSEVSGGQAKVYPPIGSSGLPQSVDTASYGFDLDSAATFRYVVVAMQYGSNPLQDWKVVGAYGYSHGVGHPDSVAVSSNTFVNGIDIEVDFQNTPPTPFVGSSAPASRK